jgi:hypothetical protein
MEERLSISKISHLEKLRIGMAGVPPPLSDSCSWIKRQLSHADNLVLSFILTAGKAIN